MLDLTRRLTDFLRRDLRLEGPVPLHAPRFEGREWELVKDCLDTAWVSSVGAYVDQFERDLAARCGTRFAVATVNGTAALHAALAVLGVRPGDLVLCPSLTFVATANAIAYCGAQPFLVDADRATLGIDCAKLERLLDSRCRPDANGQPAIDGRPVRACVPVHIFGTPGDMDELARICARFGIPVIEDSTEALGSRYRGRPCGGLAPLGVFSFNGNKLLTTGGGGMVVTDDETLARRLKHLTTTARVPDRWHFDHDEVGFNYRLPNINAALGCAQMERLDGMLERKVRLAKLYEGVFDGCAEGVPFRPPAECASNFWLNAVVLARPEDRDRVLTETNDLGLQTRPCWVPMHRTTAHGAAPRMDDLSGTEWLFERIVNIPSSPWMLDRSPS